MPHAKVGIPLAFLLALSAASSNTGAAVLSDTKTSLEPGSLRGLLDQDKPIVSEPSARARNGASRRGIAQWFNGCFMGFWRRC